MEKLIGLTAQLARQLLPIQSELAPSPPSHKPAGAPAQLLQADHASQHTSCAESSDGLEVLNLAIPALDASFHLDGQRRVQVGLVDVGANLLLRALQSSLGHVLAAREPMKCP